MTIMTQFYQNAGPYFRAMFLDTGVTNYIWIVGILFESTSNYFLCFEKPEKILYYSLFCGISITTECFTDLRKLNFLLGSNKFTLLPQLPLKNDAQIKSGQNQLDNNQLALLI